MSDKYYQLKDEWLTITMGKAEYQFRHRIDPAIHLDTWLVQRVSINAVVVMDGTDMEGPIKQVDTTDFIGGIHGDEQYLDVKILVDGKDIAVCETIEKTNFDRIDIFVTSHLFFCNTSRVAFERRKHLLFAENKLIISNAMTYVGEEDFYVYRWPANGIFSIYKDAMYSYTTNESCQPITDAGTAPSKGIDVVSFYGENYCVVIRSLAEKYDSYQGWVTDFAMEARPRFKAYFDTLDNAKGDVILKTSAEILASYEIEIV